MIQVTSHSRNNRFTTAVHGAKLIRHAFEPYLKAFSDPDISQRLIKVLMRVLNSGSSNSSDPHLMDGDLSHLKWFSFNKKALFYRTFGGSCDIWINREAGEVNFDVFGLNPGISICNMKSATHFKMICAIAELDFENQLFNTVDLSGNLTRTDFTEELPVFRRVEKMKTANGLPLMAIVGVQFFYKHFETAYPVMNTTKTPLEIVWIDYKRSN